MNNYRLWWCPWWWWWPWWRLWWWWWWFPSAIASPIMTPSAKDENKWFVWNVIVQATKISACQNGTQPCTWTMDTFCHNRCASSKIRRNSCQWLVTNSPSAPPKTYIFGNSQYSARFALSPKNRILRVWLGFHRRIVWPPPTI